MFQLFPSKNAKGVVLLGIINKIFAQQFGKISGLHFFSKSRSRISATIVKSERFQISLFQIIEIRHSCIVVVTDDKSHKAIAIHRTFAVSISCKR